MIFSTINQLPLFCITVFAGIIASIGNSILGIIFLSKHQKRFVNVIFKIICLLLASIALIFFINYFCYGNFSPIIILGFIFGYIWIKLSSVKLLDFLQIKFYYMYIHLILCIKFYFARKNESIKD